MILNVVSPLQLNRFKGLDLIDRVPDEQWTEVRGIVQQAGITTIPMEKKCKKAKWLSGEALQIAVRRRDVKSKGDQNGLRGRGRGWDDLGEWHSNMYTIM